MQAMNKLVHTILHLSEPDRNRDHIVKLKRARAKDNKMTDVPTNIQVLKTYYATVAQYPEKKVDRIESLLKKRSIRSQS